ncbi:PDZ domain-containing protein [Angustibacter peucedani]
MSQLQTPPLLSGPPPRSSSGLTPRTLTVVLTGLLAIGLAAVVALVPAPYAIYAPGPATNVLGQVGGTDLIRVDGTESYRPTGKGTLDMTTVAVFGGPGHKVTLLDVFRSWVSPTQAVIPEEQVFPPGQTQGQAEAETAAEMSDSQQSATAAGLRELGRTVPETITIADVGADLPAAKVLKAGDVITGFQGSPVSDSAALRKQIQSLKSGATVKVQVRRDGSTREVTTQLASSEGRTVLGVGLSPTYDFPVDVKFATKDVGGPSAGMMFALGIYDLLTPGDLTGGAKIAGTGTIDGAGNVGPIGGIAQKLVGAKNAGAQWFLAPSSNCDEVVGNVPSGLRVVKTSTLHESRTDVEKIAAGQGGSLPTCTKTS